ncbi:MAG: uroporphyrinogen decarboxylase family protein [bacterium]
MATAPAERLAGLLAGRVPSEPLVFPLVVADHAARIAGVEVGRAARDPSVLTRVLAAARERYRYDCVLVFADTVVEAEAMGAAVELPEDDNAFFVAAPDTVRTADPERDGRMPVVLEAVRRLRDELDESVPVLGSLKGPFSLASFLAGIEDLLGAVIASPARAVRFLDLALDNQARFAAAICRAGGVPFIGDPVASGSLIGPGVFRRFAAPYLCRLIEAVHALGSPCGLHVCGRTLDLLPDIVATGADILSIEEPDLAAARAKVGPGVVLMGSVPTELVRSGTAAAVRNEAARCLAVAGPRLILSTACDVPADSPMENVAAIVAAAREAKP